MTIRVSAADQSGGKRHGGADTNPAGGGNGERLVGLGSSIRIGAVGQ